MTNNKVSVYMQDQYAIVRINNPPVNAASSAVRLGLMEAISRVNSMEVRAAILICEGKTFIAGGDLKEFDQPAVEPHLPDVVLAIEDSDIPFVAAMHGSILGGGFEIALGCSWRISTVCARFGFPEVNVGLVPGAGGTQRLPRLVGLRTAMELCTTGKHVSAQTMFDDGGLDKIVDTEHLLESAIGFLEQCGPRPMKVRDMSVDLVSDELLSTQRCGVEKKAKGQASPLHNYDCLLSSFLPFEQGQLQERALHLALRQSDESKALRHAFFAERIVANPHRIKGVRAEAVAFIGVVGGGLMGSGIATSLLNAGYSVVVLEQTTEAVASAQSRVENNLNGSLKRGKFSAQQRDDQLANLVVTTDSNTIASADMVIEAVFEDVLLKQKLFTEVASIVKRECILATNTSYLDPILIFKNIEGLDRCVGLHFFSPAHIMRLLEVIALPQSSTTTLSTAFSFAKQLGKVGVLSGICDGFIGNRMLAAYRREAEYMLADGATPNQIDNAMRSFGYAMGPFEAQDMGGLQIAWSNRQSKAASRDHRERYVAILDALCALGRYGQRSKAGWYAYPDGLPLSKQEDHEVTQIIETFSHSNNIDRRAFSDSEIVSRLIAVLANEGALLVEDGIAENHASVDMVQIHGYGFPRWRGGPMHYADTLGKNTISQSLELIVSASPDYWRIAKQYQS